MVWANSRVASNLVQTPSRGIIVCFASVGGGGKSFAVGWHVFQRTRQAVPRRSFSSPWRTILFQSKTRFSWRCVVVVVGRSVFHTDPPGLFLLMHGNCTVCTPPPRPSLSPPSSCYSFSNPSPQRYPTARYRGAAMSLTTP